MCSLGPSKGPTPTCLVCVREVSLPYLTYTLPYPTLPAPPTGQLQLSTSSVQASRSGPPSPPARTPSRIPSPHAVGDASRGARRERREGGDAMEPEGGCDSGEARGGARPSSCLSMVA